MRKLFASFAAFAACLFAGFGTARAEVGDLTYSSEAWFGAEQALEPHSFMATGKDDFTKPAENSGTVHPKATVAKFKLDGHPFLVAIDSKNADDKLPNVLRFDFDGTGRFNDRDAVPLELRGFSGGFYANANATLVVELQNQKIPVLVNATYVRNSDDSRYLNLTLCTAASGQCAFGTKNYLVKIADYSGNMEINDPAKPVLRDGQPVGGEPGDILRINVPDHKPPANTKITAFYGQPVQVNGVWYDVKVDPKTRKVSAQPMPPPAGKIHVAHDSWTAILVGKSHVLNLSGSQEPLAVPPDIYFVQQYSESGPKSKSGRRANFSSSWNSDGQPRLFSVSANEITELPLGSPLSACVSANTREDFVSNRLCHFRLKLTDSAGLDVDNLRLENGNRPPAPQFKVLNAKGETVHTAKLEYG